MEGDKSFSWLCWIGLLNLATVLTGSLAWKYLAEVEDGKAIRDSLYLNLTLIFVALITFFGFLMRGEAKGGNSLIDKGGMRTAITATVITVYLVLVGMVAFMVTAPEKMPTITTTMLTNFTTIVGVVIAFYFGASAYIQAQEKSESRKDSDQ
jgi:hypothetical protein